MKVELVEQVMRFLPGEVIGRIASALGVDPAAAATAVPAMISGLVDGLARKASSDGGARDLATSLGKRDLAGLGKLVGMIGGPGQSDAASQGAMLASELLGAPERDALIGTLATTAGIKPHAATTLLSILTPVVAGVILQRQQAGHLDTTDLARLLAPDPDSADSATAEPPPVKLEAAPEPQPRPIVDPIVIPDIPKTPRRELPVPPAPSAATVDTLVAPAASMAPPSPPAGGAGIPDAVVTPKRELPIPSTPPAATVDTLVAPVASMAPPSAPAGGAGIPDAVMTPKRELPIPSAPPAAAVDTIVAPVASMAPPSPPAGGAGIADIAEVAPTPRRRTMADLLKPLEKARQDAEATKDPTTEPILVPEQAPGGTVRATPVDRTAADGPNAARRRRPSMDAIVASDREFLSPPARRQRDAGHHLARFGWILPILLLLIGGAWWLNYLSDNPGALAPASETAAVVVTVPASDPVPRRDMAKSSGDGVVSPPPVIAIAPPVEAPKSDPPMSAPSIMTKPADVPPVRSGAEKVAATDTTVPRDDEATRKADASIAAAAAAAAKAANDAEAARRAELARKAEAAAAAAKAALDAEARRLADAARAAAVGAGKARAVTPTAATTAATTASLAACQKAVRETTEDNRIRFEFASAEITDATAPILDRLAEILKKCPGARLRVEGHTDTDGHFDRNQRLSENRARQVAAHLSEAGVAAARMTAIGFGQTKPRYPNTTETNKRLNRRIELAIVTQ